MAKITVKKLTLAYPPRISFGTLESKQYPYSYGNQLAMFCSTVKGERPFLPDWGLPELIHQPVLSNQELEAIILANVKQYFPNGRFNVTAKDDQNRPPGYKSVNIEYQIDNESGIIEVEI